MNSNYFVVEEIVEDDEVMSNQPEVVQQETEEEMDVVADNLAECPSCGKNTLKIEGGCHSCVNEECGFSKCDM